MVLVLDRFEFKKYWEPVVDTSSDKGFLWIPEQQAGVTCSHFLYMISLFNIQEMFKWVDANLNGKVFCFSMSQAHEAWWGFTEETDIALFILRWS